MFSRLTQCLFLCLSVCLYCLWVTSQFNYVILLSPCVSFLNDKISNIPLPRPKVSNGMKDAGPIDIFSFWLEKWGGEGRRVEERGMSYVERVWSDGCWVGGRGEERRGGGKERGRGRERSEGKREKEESDGKKQVWGEGLVRGWISREGKEKSHNLFSFLLFKACVVRHTSLFYIKENWYNLSLSLFFSFSLPSSPPLVDSKINTTTQSHYGTLWSLGVRWRTRSTFPSYLATHVLEAPTLNSLQLDTGTPTTYFMSLGLPFPPIESPYL